MDNDEMLLAQLLESALDDLFNDHVLIESMKTEIVNLKAQVEILKAQVAA